MIQKSSEGTLRLFIGIAVPPVIISRLDELVQRLKPLAPIRWTPDSNFHITTKFIGAWPRYRLDTMAHALIPLRDSGLLRIAIRGLGFYPNARRARIFWAGIDGGPPLAELANQTDRACAALGVKPEEKRYSPHLTLARIDSPSGLEALHEAIAVEPNPEFGEFIAGSFHLYESRPGSHGSVYTSLAEFPL
jgi:2'-5' RNA ligase